VVVLHRVVCCYPDYERLLGAAAGRARRAIVFSHPRRNLASRGLIALENLAFRARRMDFRTFVHPPAAMADVCRDRGFTRRLFHPGRVWQVQGLTR
jgi:magnesium-protoporphyrin O-methyltransferase